jgi:hypothetical protein
MNMRQMADALGMTKHSFRRLFDRYQLQHIKQGRDNVLDVKTTLKVLAKVPGIEFLISKHGIDLIAKARTGKLDIATNNDSG